MRVVQIRGWLAHEALDPCDAFMRSLGPYMTGSRLGAKAQKGVAETTPPAGVDPAPL